MTDS